MFKNALWLSIAFVVLAVAAAEAGLYVYREGIIQYQAAGTVYDGYSKRPLSDVIVVLTVDENEAADKELIDRRLKMMYERSANKDEMPGYTGPKVGMSDKDGRFLARIRHKPAPGTEAEKIAAKDPGAACPTAWLIIGKEGYKSQVIEYETKKWKLSDYYWKTGVNDVEDVYLTPVE